MTNLQAMAIVAAGIHIPLALTVWSMLHRRWQRPPLLLWVTGSLALGVGATLIAARDNVPPWATYELGNALMSLAPALRIAALRLDLGWPVRGRWLAALALADFGGYLLSLNFMDEKFIVLLAYTTMTMWTLAFAWHAAAIGRQLASRSGWVLAGVEALFGASCALRVLSIALGWTQGRSISGDWDFALLVVSGLAAALYGNLGYLGLVMDRTSAAAQRAREAELTEALKREAAEKTTTELRGLLLQREQLFQLLAHEIRQPLHNVSGALQAADLALAGPAAPASTPAERDAQIAERLQRAQDVLGNMHAVLDNTLAAATLLARKQPLVLVETELDFMVQLTLGDLPAALRARTQLRWQVGFHSAALEPGLVRLALRNLLLNAFAHGGPAVRVQLEVAGQAEPAALLLRVVDDGPGMPDEVRQRIDALATTPTALVPAGADDGRAARRQPLGLLIVQRVMAAHGGALVLAANRPGGLVASLVFPRQTAPAGGRQGSPDPRPGRAGSAAVG